MESKTLPGTGLPDHNRGPEILAICSSLVTVAFIFLAIRFFVRIKMTKELGWDDWFCLASWVVTFAEMMLIIPEVKYGAGRHVVYIQPPSNIQKGLKLNFFTQPMCVLGVTLIKISIGFFLLRISSSVKYTRIIIGIIVFTSLAGVAHITVVFFQCQPLPYIWGEGEGTCMKGSHLRFSTFFNSGVGIVTDMIFALIPIPMLWHLQMNRRTKAVVCLILSLGIFATSAAVVKVLYLRGYGKHGDFLYDSTDMTIWTTAETCVGIVAGCFPCLKPIFKAALAGSFLSKSSKSHSGYNRQDPRSKTTGKTKENNGGFEMYGNYTSEGASATEMGLDRRDNSQDSILREMTGERQKGIMKTTQVRLDYEHGEMPKRDF